MKTFVKWLYIFLVFLIVNSCEKVTPYNKDDCSIKNQNEFVYEYMQNNYLWYQDMPKLDYLAYNSPEMLLNDLKVSLDKWSFIIDKKVLDNYFSGGKYIGFGFSKTKSNNKLYIAMVFPNSPADKAGLKRGMEILEINGVSVANKSESQINELLGDNAVGVSGYFKINDSGEIKNFTIQKDYVKIQSVIKSEIIYINNKYYGYLVFNSFIEPSYDELTNAFKYFKSNGVDGIIIDLRYNGGGLVGVANHLANLLIGKNYDNNLFLTLKFNDKNSKYNRNYYLDEKLYSFDLNEVYFITTNRSCSASEAVINGLKPYVNVKIFGQKSCGKPVGMVGEEFCGKYLMPIEFKIVNSNDEGDYFNGIDVDCSANDDLTHDFGDLDENMLQEVAYYIQNGSCSQNSYNARLVNSKTDKKFGIKSIFDFD